MGDQPANDTLFGTLQRLLHILPQECNHTRHHCVKDSLCAKKQSCLNISLSALACKHWFCFHRAFGWDYIPCMSPSTHPTIVTCFFFSAGCDLQDGRLPPLLPLPTHQSLSSTHIFPWCLFVTGSVWQHDCVFVHRVILLV